MSDFGSGTPEPVVGMYGLRTFKITDGRLSSVVAGTGHWEDGVCEAVCTRNPDHQEPPVDGCSCGIYCTHSLAALFAQYSAQAQRIVCVIAPEGPTLSGDTGMRTNAARIVACWCGEPNWRIVPSEREVCRKDAPGARQYYDLRLMVKLYGLKT
jgi:hypothetical protein